MASAAVEGNWTANFTTSDQTKDQTYTDYTAIFPAEGCPLTITFTGMTPNTTGTNQANGEYPKAGTDQAYDTAIRPNVNVGNGGSYILNFTLTNGSDETVNINAITLNTFAYNSGGGKQSDTTNSRAITFTLSSGTTQIATADVTFTQAKTENAEAWENWDNDTSFQLGSEHLTLGAKQHVTLSIQVEKAQSAGTFVGISGATFSVIPEPTTATLSLLALCGLAARRRRK